MIKITQLNILANIWLTDEYKLLPCYPLYNSPLKLEITLNYLRKQESDIYFLSEVLESNLPRIREKFPEYTCLFTSNDPSFWREWLNDKEWEGNGTCILYKGILDDYGSYDLGEGCRCVCARISKVILVSVHFDNDSNTAFSGDSNTAFGNTFGVASNNAKGVASNKAKSGNSNNIKGVPTMNRKYLEVEKLLELLSGSRDCTIIISGDYNFTDVSRLLNEGYRELIGSYNGVGKYQVRRDTQPTRYSTPLHEGIIDHTLIYSPLKFVCEGRIDTLHDSGKEDLIHKGMQFCKTLMINGSDHYCTTGVVKFL